MVSPAARPAGPRLAAFGSALYPPAVPFARRGPATPEPVLTFPDSFDVVVLAAARPVRLRLTIRVNGKPMHEAWRTAMKKAFDHFDRDGDGFLSGHETESVFSASGVAQVAGHRHLPADAGRPADPDPPWTATTTGGCRSPSS